jgi:hypothetical protein
MKRIALFLSFALLFNIVFGGNPRLSFFCELPEKEFNELFADLSLSFSTVHFGFQ